ncbi:Prophage CP4-57 integrase [Phocoenobacter uteri]|uniref:Prophage CP4-57 integrase n=1 Tax=Phocoenobacter uteri TaxID=146806 RepID=A0A379CBH6_9PAST|nr:tyrosine-type recombinase/integrase [Phocoenobacter uteri]MDG6881037.1 integrase [Phocoenobacter uteri]SUB59056.1 Prophage CP4-57 integrase [Phocoenobacter uteri]SUB76455.1 Prophage CP4-57 integrase [Phocoenobacter uteri]
MLSNSKLKSLKPKEKAYKVADRDGLYVFVSKKGTISFRYDYIINKRRETLTIGRFGADGISLSEAREKLMMARKLVSEGISPANEKRQKKFSLSGCGNFGFFAEKYLKEVELAESTRQLRRATFEREIKPYFGNKLMTEIKAINIRNHCEIIRDRGAPSTAIFVRDFFNLVYKFAISKGAEFGNPAEKVANSSIATFKPRERVLTPREIHLFFNELNNTERYFTLRKGILFILYTMVRKGELVSAKWDEFDFNKNIWTIPAERMKARRSHNVYLSRQALELLTAFKIYSEESEFVIPSRTSLFKPVSLSSLNRVVSETVKIMQDKGMEIDHFTIHDLRRTASTLLHEKGFNSDWIEKALAHEQKGVRAVYNKAEYAEQRREMMQKWADMVDCWIRGQSV